MSISHETSKEIFKQIEHLWSHDFFPLIRYTLDLMRSQKDYYRILQFKDEYIIVLKLKSVTETVFCIGYPFPIIENNVSNSYVFNGASVRVCFHGMALRIAQKKHFMQELAKQCTLNRHIIRSEDEFRYDFKQSIQRYGKTLWYFDSYRFIGDSILNTYMMDLLVQEYNLSPVFVSRHNQHLSSLYNVLPIIDSEKKILPNQVYAYPDLLDNDSGWIYYHIIHNNLPGLYLFPGKNFFISKNNQHASVFSLDQNDIFLKEQNVFDYMYSCIKPFIEHIIPQYESVQINRDNLKAYLNFSSSLQDKSLSLTEVQGLINILHIHGIEIWMSAGYNTESIQIANLMKRNNPYIHLIQTHDLSDIARLFTNSRINLVISPDSSICHLSVKQKIPTIILYKARYWDSHSLLSLSAESPLGFCGIDPHYLPILLCDYSESAMLQAFEELLDFLLYRKKDIFSNKTLSNFDSLLKNCIDKSEALIKLKNTAKLINLYYKLEEYYK